MNFIKYFILIILILSVNQDSKSNSIKKTVLNPKSRIERVMVYKDRALITRGSKLLKLSPGKYEVNFANLPPLINDDSVRAKIYNTRNLKILDVEVKSYQLEKIPELKIRKLQEELQNFSDRKKRIENRLKVYDLEHEYLLDIKNNFIKSGFGNIKTKRTEKGIINQFVRLKIKDYENMLNFLNKKFQKNADAVIKEEFKVRDIEKKIKFIRSKMRKLNVNQSAIPRKKLIRVTIDVLKSGSYTLDVLYINYKIKWEPSYDIRVFYKNKKTEFIGYGVVSQNSGEDWINTKLFYSTAQPALRRWLPDIVPLYATLSNKLSGQRKRKKSMLNYRSQMALNRSYLDNQLDGKIKKRRRGEGLVTESSPSTKNRRQAGSLVFNVLKRSDILSDGAPHRTAISRQTFPVKFEYICIPKLSPHAYLQAIGKNTMPSPILRGDLNIFMGNDFVGSSSTGNILPGEDFELILSVNENIRVTRILEEKEEKKAGFLNSSRKTKYTFVIKIENYSKDDVVMKILDQVPVSKTEDVDIEIHKFSHKPDKINKKGIVKWDLKIKSKETVKITFSFTITVPKDKIAAFFKTNLPPSVYLQNLPQLRDNEMRKQKKKGPAMRMKLY